jgi:hypothetical protein
MRGARWLYLASAASMMNATGIQSSHRLRTMRKASREDIRQLSVITVVVP